MSKLSLDTSPHRFSGLSLGLKHGSMRTNHDDFRDRGEQWATPFIEDAEPVKRSRPDIMKGYYTLEDSQRMIDADMARRRKMFRNMRAVVETGSKIPREE